MVSHPENGSDSPIGSDRNRGRDICRRQTSRDNDGFLIFALISVMASNFLKNVF